MVLSISGSTSTETSLRIPATILQSWKQATIVYNPRSSSTAPVGPISENQIGTGVMSPIYTVCTLPERRQCPDFFAHYFRTRPTGTGICGGCPTEALGNYRMAITNDDLISNADPDAIAM